MGAYNRKDLKAYVRYDGNGRVVAGSLVLRRRKPKVGKWIEIPAYECCNSLTPTTTTTTTTASPTTTTTTTSGISSYSYNVLLAFSPSNVCNSGNPDVFYSNLSSLQIGSIMYEDPELTIPYQALLSEFFFSNGGNSYSLSYTGGPGSSLVIGMITSC